MKLLFWDIETAPTSAYIWKLWKENISPAQIIEPGKVLCWSAAWAGEDHVYSDARWLNGEEQMISHLHELLNEADAHVTYNGNHFDTPTMNAAFLKYRLPPPAPSKSIDLYQVVKKRFRLLSNRLDYVAQHLGLEGKLETGGFKLWADVLDGKKYAQEKMLEYNIQDVELLENVYNALFPWISNLPQAAHFTGADHVCPACGSGKLQRRGYYRTKIFSYQRYQCSKCGSWSRARKRDAEQGENELVAV